MNTAHILLIDDNQSDSQKTVQLLSDSGYRCTHLEDFTKNNLPSDSFDCAIFDITNDPDSKFYFIKNKKPHFPIIITTKNPDYQTILQCLQLPVVDYIEKPLEKQSLKNSLHKALAFKQYQNQVHSIHKSLSDNLKELETTYQHNQSSFITRNQMFAQNLLTHHLKCFTNAILNIQKSTKAQLGSEKIEICDLLDCPRLRTLMSAIDETIDTLNETKKYFKSQTLSKLRQKLEKIRSEITI